MHITVRPFLTRARWPAVRLSVNKLPSPPLLAAALRVASTPKCFSTSIASREPLPTRPFSLRFSELKEEDEAPTLPDILELSPLKVWSRPSDAWLHRLDHFLPAHLRSSSLETSAITEPKDAIYVRRALLHILTATQNLDQLDLLVHLGLDKQRWDVVAWVVKEVVRGHRQFRTVVDDIRTTGIQWPTQHGLNELTDKPFQEPTLGPRLNISPNLRRSSQYNADPRVFEKRLQHGGLGRIWRSMGRLILEASSRPAKESRTIISHVLIMMAHLHRGDIVPAAVYKHVPDQLYMLQQPPILHMFSSRIMTALSEAAWNAHQASVSAVFGDAPGTRYNSQVEALSPEVWLELVLWSCLHGGWVVDGVAVLEMMQRQTGVNKWSLVCWKQVLQTSHLDTRSSDSLTWKDLMDVLEKAGAQTHHSPNDHSSIARTISRESVAAYIDALTNEIFTGVGQRGIPANEIVSQLKGLKGLLDKQKLGLGNVTWEAIVQRLAESNGIFIERDPSLMLKLLELVQPYGVEAESNAIVANKEQTIAPHLYFFETSASSLGLFHRVLQAHVSLGGVEGTMSGLRALQEYTDRNQRRSIEHFFQELKGKSYSDFSSSQEAGFSSVDYPAFFPQIPVDVLGSMMDLFTEAGISTSAIQLLQSNDPSGPIIPETYHLEPALAPALIRYATAANNKAMLEKVVSTHSSLVRTRKARIPRPVLTALLASQIYRRRWDSVHSVLSASTTGGGARQLEFNEWHPSLACYLAGELLCIKGQSDSRGYLAVSTDSPDFFRASDIFRTLLSKGYGRISPRAELMKDGSLEVVDSWKMLHSTLGVLASVNSSWASFCLPLLLRGGNQPLGLDTSHFNIILQGLVDGYGAERGQILCQQWCVSAPNLPAQYRRPGGVEKMPNVQPSNFLDSFSGDWSVEVTLPRRSDDMLRFYGRVMPNLTTVRIVLRRVLEDEVNGQLPMQEMLDWVVSVFNGLGYRGKGAEKEISRIREGVEWRLNRKQK
ncbi:hypothetical protein E6O75_ATG04517 [Venturia nashicola]|uniref:Uncharacterized protein n=1 Tax=Venturia nashicola TaxID=86259 RepID=A0A4Z1PQZ9_9PEZI|nr:hypothetical protein E6O75_ATG04517 [Venturia nashicola]